MKSLKVRSIMTHPVVSLERDHSILLAGSLMRLRHIRHLPVADKGRLVGLVTHRDLLAAQAALLAAPRGALTPEEMSVPVSRIMITNVWSTSPDTSLLDAGRIMLDHKYGCLPVVEDGKLVGIVTEVDLLALLLDELESRREREDTDPRLRIGG